MLITLFVTARITAVLAALVTHSGCYAIDQLGRDSYRLSLLACTTLMTSDGSTDYYICMCMFCCCTKTQPSGTGYALKCQAKRAILDNDLQSHVLEERKVIY
jgi:hypothetical protein